MFAAELFRMYSRYAEEHGWRVETLSSNATGLGGFKEVIALIEGRGAYSRLKFEGGVHRVQRVPETEASGRIHTSTVTVAVLPEADDVDVHIDETKDLRIDVYRSSGPGGQSVNTTDSAVRVTHLPSGLVVACQDEKSQHKNRAKAIKILRARLLERAQAEQQAEEAENRRSMVGTGERSERIRTYNFPQGRVTDHRINMTLYSLDRVIEGEIEPLIDALDHASPVDGAEGRELMDAAAESSAPSPAVAALLAEATAALGASGVPNSRLDAEVLLATACAVDRTQLYVRANQPVGAVTREAFRALVERRLQREPLQYIIGRQEFWSIDFMVTPAVLIPRPETELLVELAVALFPPLKKGDRGGFSLPSTDGPQSKSPLAPLFQRGGSEKEHRLTICDLGTGSGCIAVALAHELPHADICAVEQSAAAVAVARDNARRQGAEHVHFCRGDLFAPLAAARFDLIVCNPPYIATGVLADLQPELAWEPRAALDGGADGLAVIRRVVAAAPAHLESGGWLLMEIGADQGPAVLDLARAAQLHDVSVRDDYAGHPRVLLARYY